MGSGILLWRIDRSPFGNALEAIRDNETRATFIGLSVRALPLVGVFVVSAAFVGLAGTATALLRTLRSARRELDSHGKE